MNADDLLRLLSVQTGTKPSCAPRSDKDGFALACE